MPNSPHVAGLSDIGRNRKRNEDSLFLLPTLGVAVVADGMGGHPGGDVASRIAAETAARLIGEARENGAAGADILAHLRSAVTSSVVQAHETIRAQSTAEPELEGMGTTLTAMIIDPETDIYVLGHVGDSRAYLFRGGKLTQLTRDDTWVQERVDKGDIPAEAARKHPFGHLLTQCLGLEDAPTPQILDGLVEVGDTYLLCTDGLVGMLEDFEIELILAKGRSATDGPDAVEWDAPLKAMIDAANAAGGHDNITAALVRIDAHG